jgi:hypothetical protein
MAQAWGTWLQGGGRLRPPGWPGRSTTDCRWLWRVDGLSENHHADDEYRHRPGRVAIAAPRALPEYRE